jgi:hypothetical protein
MGTVTVGIAQMLLEKDTEPLRFERYCVDLIAEMEGGARIVTTSSNYDKSRDGISVGGTLYIVLMCSLADDVDRKALRDAKSLVRGVPSGKRVPDAVYFCSSQRFTETKSDELEQLMRTELSLPAGYERVTALSGPKLAQLGSKQAGLFERHYPGELADIKRALAESPDAVEAEHALRLALSTSGADEAADIREEVWKALLRLHLAKGQATAGVLATAISNYLKLSSALSHHVLGPHVDSLIRAGQVDLEDGVYSLTRVGHEAYEEDEARVARSIFEGKEALTSALKAHLRTEITHDQADRMWNAVQEQVATLFHERGQEVLGQVARLIDKQHEDGDDPEREFDLIKALASAAAAPFAHSDQQQEVETAFKDIMIEGDSAAVQWLTRTAYAFVCACAMGLEAKTRSALEDVIGGTNLIFDTDVVLSYLSPDEPAHEGAKAIKERWRSLGGKILLADEVNFEVAHHAWIAQTDSEHTGSHALASKIDRHVLSKNAFVRGYWLLVSKGKVKRNQWGAWIGQFRGKKKSDTSVTRRTLTQDHGFGVLPAPSGAYRKLAAKALLFLNEENEKGRSDKYYDDHDEFIRGDKASRDAQLFAATVQIREKGDEGGREATFLLTSSGRFGRLERKFRPREDSFVLTIPTVIYLISMAPDRGLGLTALRAFLFDERWKERLSDFELMALRVVKKSKEFDMPWAKRSTLIRRLKERVHRIAKDRSKGVPGGKRVTDADVKKEWTTQEGRGQLLAELAGALDDVASDRRGEIELAKAREEIADLRRQLAERDRAPRHPRRGS